MSVSLCPMIILQTVIWTEQKFFFHLGWLKKPPNLSKNCLDLCCSHCLSELTYVWHWSVQWKTNWHTQSGAWRCHYMMRSHNSFSKHISTTTRTLHEMGVCTGTTRWERRCSSSSDVAVWSCTSGPKPDCLSLALFSAMSFNAMLHLSVYLQITANFTDAAEVPLMKTNKQFLALQKKKRTLQRKCLKS